MPDPKQGKPRRAAGPASTDLYEIRSAIEEGAKDISHSILRAGYVVAGAILAGRRGLAGRDAVSAVGGMDAAAIKLLHLFVVSDEPRSGETSQLDELLDDD